MAIITRFGGSGGGTPIVDPYPHVWECTVVQSGTTGVVSGVVTLEAYDILHYTMPLGFSTYDLMIGGVTYHTSFRNEGEMYVQWTGSDFVVVSANAACTLPHVWVNPTYTITGSVLEITAGVDDLHTNDVIELTLSSGESASVIEYDSNTYLIDNTIDDSQTNYVMFNGTSFELLNPKFNFVGDATVSDVLSGKKFYSNSDTLLTGTYTPPTSTLVDDFDEVRTLSPDSSQAGTIAKFIYPNANVNEIIIFPWVVKPTSLASMGINSITKVQNGSDVEITLTSGNSGFRDATQLVAVKLKTFRVVRFYETSSSPVIPEIYKVEVNGGVEKHTFTWYFAKTISGTTNNSISESYPIANNITLTKFASCLYLFAPNAIHLLEQRIERSI